MGLVWKQMEGKRDEIESAVATYVSEKHPELARSNVTVRFPEE